MKIVDLGSVATIERKGVDPTALPPDTLYLGLEHIERGGRIIGRDTVAGAELASTKFQFTPEHVLFGKLRPNLGKIGRPGFAGVCSTDILPVRPGKDLDRDYLAHYLAQPSMIDFAASRTSGANLPRLSPAVLEKFPIPLPPLPEQRRIAAILDHADALRAKRRQVLAHVDAVAPAVLSGILAGADFPAKSLADVAEIWDCPHSTPKWTTSGSICLRTPNLTRGEWNWDDTRYVDEIQFKDRSKGGGARPGDIILSREGTVGIAAIVQPGLEVCMGQRLVQVRPDPAVLHPEWALHFLLAALHPDRISGIMVGSTAKHLNVKDLRALPIPVPPLEIQASFAERTSSITSARQKIDQARAVEEELFATLQSRAFRGEL